VEEVMNSVTASELKAKGMSVVESRLTVEEEVIISVRGQDKYVVMDLEKYTRLRGYELEVAVQEAKADLETDQYQVYTVNDHMK
jgi:prevent-host-death family protein